MSETSRNRRLDRTVPHRDILVAVLGVSPAILTETLWCLAHENPPIFPQKIIVFTTLRGRDSLKRYLFQQPELCRLRQTLHEKNLDPGEGWHFGMASDCIRLFPSPDGSCDLEDIANSLDSQAAADYLFRSLRDLTSDPKTRLIASLAGGRKTMGALLTSCMVLLGRRQDRLCHVLVNTPFDSPHLQPPFYFPVEGRMHHLPGNEEVFPSVEARVELTDIPFVRVRGWYEQEYRHAVPTYMSMVRKIQDLVPDPNQYPCITIDMRLGTLAIDGRDAGLSPGEFALFITLEQRARKGAVRLNSWMEISSEMEELHQGPNAAIDRPWLHDFQEKSFVLKEDARKLASSLRRKLTAIVPERSMVNRLVPTPKIGSVGFYPASRIRILHSLEKTNR